MMDNSKQAYSNPIQRFIRTTAVPVGLAILSVGAGTVGYFLHLSTQATYQNATSTQIFIESFFRSLGFLTLSMGTVRSIETLPYLLITLGRLFGLLFFSYAAITTLSWILAKELRPLRVDLWSILDWMPTFDDRGHLIVCGVGDEGYALANEALENDRNVVAIDTTQNDLTEELKKNGAIVFEGDASHSNVLVRQARLQRASNVFVTAGSDTTNGAIVETINRWASNNTKSEVLEISARITDRRLRKKLHEETSATGDCFLRTYDVQNATARELLASYPVDDIDNTGQRVHVWIVGWTPFSKALFNQLLHLMHYPDDINRKITIIVRSPDEVERNIMEHFPGIHSNWWKNDSASGFVDKLFPDLSVESMPVSDMELLSDRPSIYDTLEKNDKLTIFADDPDECSLRALVSVWAPKINNLTRKFDLDTRIVYRSPEESISIQETSIQTTTFTEFTSGYSIQSARGDYRDRVARQLALIYHLLYEQDSSDLIYDDNSVPRESLTDVESITKWLDSIPHKKRKQYSRAVWRQLPESQRESNRYAADHASVKLRMADLLSENTLSKRTVRAVAEAEHRRWCAEKILKGWMPLPPEKVEQWNTDAGQKELREQYYHPDICSVESLRNKTDGEWSKDLTQVKVVLNYPDIIGCSTTSKKHGEHWH